MQIAVIRYNAGNNFSVLSALRRLGYEAIVTDDPAALAAADKVIFPGVGQASSAMEYLRKTGLDQVIRDLKQPVLGICIGQQLMCKRSEEGGGVDCLGIFDAEVKRFQSDELKIPHMGWDTLDQVRPGLFLQSSLQGRWVYYVHSYYVPVIQETVAVTDYITPFSAALQRDNFYATQFHPEKSGDTGEQILREWLTTGIL
ncbi:MAG: imidazole glycerol phosphate synthase subunit HisH [Bacteroidales bacterium]|nr:imidazole glycerol phosphate synthase subunit HisH [Bacteroidales bacterium]